MHFSQFCHTLTFISFVWLFWPNLNKLKYLCEDLCIALHCMNHITAEGIQCHQIEVHGLKEIVLLDSEGID